MLNKIIDAEKNMNKAKKNMTKMKTVIQDRLKDKMKMKKMIENLNKAKNKTKMKHLKKGEDKIKFLREKYNKEAELADVEKKTKEELPGLSCFKKEEDEEPDDEDLDKFS